MRPAISCLLFLLAQGNQIGGAFIPLRSFEFKRFFSSSAGPTLKQLESDPFMKQVQYASHLVDSIQSKDKTSLESLLRAQLSHPDGIRGFMVTYLTSDTTMANDPVVVATLVEQLDPVSDRNQLLALMCMNVIMPMAMTTMHTDAALQQQSRHTAERGAALLRDVLLASNDESQQSAIVEQCRAICNVAKQGQQPIDKYWSDFFEKWKYGSQQRDDIARVMQTILSSE